VILWINGSLWLDTEHLSSFGVNERTSEQHFDGTEIGMCKSTALERLHIEQQPLEGL